MAELTDNTEEPDYLYGIYVMLMRIYDVQLKSLAVTSAGAASTLKSLHDSGKIENPTVVFIPDEEV